jgi:hypothetical protein
MSWKRLRKSASSFYRQAQKNIAKQKVEEGWGLNNINYFGNHWQLRVYGEFL